jgi:hypothetical protein
MNTLTFSLKTFSRLAWLVLAVLPASIALAAPVAHFSRMGYVTVGQRSDRPAGGQQHGHRQGNRDHRQRGPA